MSLTENKVVLISGTGGGLGRAAAIRFAQAGYIVVGCDVSSQSQVESQQALQELGLELHGEGSVDLGDHTQAQAWVEAANAQFGRIDVLYNNASAAKFSPIGEFPIEDWQFTIRNELDQVFYTTRYAWQHLAKQGGVIINMASTAAWCGSKLTGKSAHSATKSAVVAFTRQIAVEGAEVGIRAVSLSPGLIKTPGTAPFIEDETMRDALLDGVLLGREGEVNEEVSMAVFVASDQAAYITGSDIVIDGGLLAT